ncbi:MAG: RNA-binding S4 domain-containing protein [Anaerovoracaceae bacterium]|jgi:ribosomal 50S subunit-recycling heat shock protein
MRIDKYLKNSRLIKRRTVAKEACEQERIFINGKIAKPGSEVKEGDEILLCFGKGEMKVRVLSVPEHAPKDVAQSMYEIIS